jgi:hypothetical protein
MKFKFPNTVFAKQRCKTTRSTGGNGIGRKNKKRGKDSSSEPPPIRNRNEKHIGNKDQIISSLMLDGGCLFAMADNSCYPNYDLGTSLVPYSRSVDTVGFTG